MDKLTLENSEISMKNWNKWEDSLDDDDALADSVANDFKNADDAIDFINMFIADYEDNDDKQSKEMVKTWKQNIKDIQDDQKHGYDLLYNNNEGSTPFRPIDQPYSLTDFRGYDEMMGDAISSSLPESAFAKDTY